MDSLERVAKDVTECEACPRLREHCLTVAREKRRAFADQDYWGRPVPGFGDSRARLLIMGLAPAAHGANRTGRMFTGDKSGDWLYRAMHRAGFATQPTSVARGDGLELRDAFITASGRCAPPDNKPEPDELARCRPFVERELKLLTEVRGYIALGQIALHSLWPLITPTATRRPKFAHGATVELPDGRWLICSYHPSQQNTFTGRLTEPMFDAVFSEAAKRLR